MDKFIKKLQNKPEKQRRKILFLSSGFITLFILVIWGFNFSKSLSSNTVGNKTVETSPFSVLKDNLSTAYQGFSQGIQSSMSSSTSSATTSTDYSTTTVDAGVNNASNTNQ